MIQLNAEQLGGQLIKALHPCYLLFGNDLFLLQESQDRIRNSAKEQHFTEHFTITLETNTDWDTVFSLCQTRSLFASRQTLLLVLPDSFINASIDEKMFKLVSLLHNDLLFILSSSKINRTMENSAWFKILSKNAVLVSCMTPKQTQLQNWVMKYVETMNLTIDNATCQLLCYFYEGNLFALTQVLKQLSLLYPDGILTVPRVKMAVNDASHFTQFHWIDAILLGKIKRAVHILHQLKLEGAEPITLLRNIQREILLIMILKRQMVIVPLCTLFDHHKIWKNRRPLLTKAIERLTLSKLHNAVKLMMKIELTLKQDYDGYLVWSDLNTLVFLLCGKSLPTAMLDI
ncbi:DNA polymerase III subunit delta [Candidatus Gullanella endobia]|uniref:DNA polymerase III subunit delta n=1 Tax=Candidatus Gullanella endobia TaxID=1070130 RepID=A0A143WRG0_9ENTR|nr:DNA polymerase III subunit delta [Candidatus Gullanella endobia]CUX96344.1 DNA polymerase III subunit delta [Candidatus Gullanella endobia]